MHASKARLHQVYISETVWPSNIRDIKRYALAMHLRGYKPFRHGFVGFSIVDSMLARNATCRNGTTGLLLGQTSSRNIVVLLNPRSYNHEELFASLNRTTAKTRKTI
jgi:hypothetical protein